LCLRRYTLKTRKIAIETKSDFKSRIGYSPDLADSFVYCLEMARRYGLVFIGSEKAVPTNRFWGREEMKQIKTEEDYSSDDWGEE
jgi:hypothetical protein